MTPSADYGSFTVDLEVPKTLRFGERRVYLRAVYPDSDTPGAISPCSAPTGHPRCGGPFLDGSRSCPDGYIHSLTHARTHARTRSLTRAPS